MRKVKKEKQITCNSDPVLWKEGCNIEERICRMEMGKN